ETARLVGEGRGEANRRAAPAEPYQLVTRNKPMSSPLTSVFRHNKKLVDCQRFDKDHIGLETNPAKDRKGLHVRLIKKALNAFARRLGMDELDETNDLYDQETADLVTTFKELHKPPILNFLGQIDAIVGKKTITALDDELRFERPLPGDPK